MKSAGDLVSAPSVLVEQDSGANGQEQESLQEQGASQFGQLSFERRVAVVNQIVDAMAKGHPFQFRKLAEDQEWLEGLKKELLHHPDLQTMTKKQIAAGIKQAKKREYMPTNAEQLVGMCRLSPEQLGLPSAQAAYREAASKSYDPHQQTWSHELVFLAGRGLWFALRTSGSNAEHAAVRSSYIAAYEHLVEKRLRGEPVAAIEDQKGDVVAQVLRDGECRLREQMRADGLPERCTKEQAFRMMGLGLSQKD